MFSREELELIANGLECGAEECYRERCEHWRDGKCLMELIMEKAERLLDDENL